MDDMLWQKEFGPEWDVPAEVLALVAEGRLFDRSWHNDSRPSFETNGKEDESGLVLYVGHPDAQHRSKSWDGVTHVPRYSIHSHDHDHELVADGLLFTDDLNEALTYIADWRDDPLNAVPSRMARDLDGLIEMLKRLRVTLPGNTPVRIYDIGENINLGPPEVLQMFETTVGPTGGGGLCPTAEEAGGSSIPVVVIQ